MCLIGFRSPLEISLASFHAHERMSDTPSHISLKVGNEISDAIKCRIMYAFRVFAAIYGHCVAEPCSSQAGITCCYGVKPLPMGSPIDIPTRYRIRAPHEPPPLLVKHRYAGQDLYLFYGVDERTGNPDWLGEIFEWLSSSHEINVAARDAIGRIPYSHSVFFEQRISPRRPYAMLLMSWFESVLRVECEKPSLPKAPSPVPEIEHFVVCSHDVDYFYTNASSALLRLIKNLFLSVLQCHDWSFFAWNVRQIFAVLAGGRVGDYLEALHEASGEFGFSSTVFVVSKALHRRDPNYRIEDLAPYLTNGVSPRFSVGLHGSYSSCVETADLASEAHAIETSLAVRPIGNRQHWLRFDDHEKLFQALQDAGFRYDSTLGFSEAPGFRNGACFAFPPYDFANEKPYPFLEIPLVLMDGNIEADARSSGEKPDDIVEEVLDESRRWGWGGISALWHNPVEPIQVPASINSIFWKCVTQQDRHREKWIGGNEFLAHSLTRYQNAGLLLGMQLDA